MPFFGDDFNGSSLDSTRWNTGVATSGNRWCPDQAGGVGSGVWIDISAAACQGLMVSPPYGSITVGGGLASFSAPDGRSFGYVVAGPPSRHPFPSSGDFAFELRMRYDVQNVAGTGVMVRAAENADPAGTDPPDAGRVFQVWNDGGGLHVALLGDGASIANGLAFHDYRLEYVGGAYSLFVDGTRALGPVASSLRPSTIWLGNSVALWWGGGSFGPWTGFSLDSISVSRFPATGSPSSVSVAAGTILSGDASSLAAGDHAYLSIASVAGNPANLTSWHGSIGNVPNSLGDLRVTYKGKNSIPATQVLQIKNFTTGSWKVLDSRTVGSSEVRIRNAVPPGTAADYVSGNGGTGEVWIRVRTSTAAGAFVQSANLLQIGYTPGS